MRRSKRSQEKTNEEIRIYRKLYCKRNLVKNIECVPACRFEKEIKDYIRDQGNDRKGKRER